MCNSLPICLPPQSNVFMYYGLSNFYQNHRRYVKSRDDSQLNGDRTSLRVCSWMFFVFTKGDDGKTLQKQAHFLSFIPSIFLSFSIFTELQQRMWTLPHQWRPAYRSVWGHSQQSFQWWVEPGYWGLWLCSAARLLPRTAAGSQECCCLNSRLVHRGCKRTDPQYLSSDTNNM